MRKEIEEAIKNILIGKLYYKNGNEYFPANEMLFNHPIIQDLIKKADRLSQIENADGGIIVARFCVEEEADLDRIFKLLKENGIEDGFTEKHFRHEDSNPKPEKIFLPIAISSDMVGRLIEEGYYVIDKRQ